MIDEALLISGRKIFLAECVYEICSINGQIPKPPEDPKGQGASNI